MSDDDQTLQQHPGKLRTITIGTDLGASSIELDGTDISHLVRGYTVQQGPGDLPIVVLQLAPQHSTALEGLARVVVGQPALDAAEFLAGIDSAALDRAALNRDLDGEPGELTRAMLAQLLEWAQGQR
jgi:hypothetical protein